MGFGNAILIFPEEYIISFQRLNDFRKQDIAIQRFRCAVINGFSHIVRNNQPGEFQGGHIGYHTGNGVIIQDFQLGDFVRSHLAFFNDRLFFALGKQILGSFGTIDVQKEQHNKRDENIAHRVTQLCASIPGGNRMLTS